MLQDYRKHVEERAQQGIPPKALNAEQVASLVDLLKNPPEGEGEFLLELLSERVPPGVDDDFSGLVYLVQLTNLSDYQGYRITTVAGFEVARRMREDEDTVTRTRGFITLYAGIER